MNRLSPGADSSQIIRDNKHFNASKISTQSSGSNCVTNTEEPTQVVQKVVEEAMDTIAREEEKDMDEDTRRIREAEAALRSLSGDFEPENGMDIFAGVATERPFFENLFEKKEEPTPKTAEVVSNSWKDVVTLSASSSSCCSSERSPLRSPILSPVVNSIKEERREEQDHVTSPQFHPKEEEYSPQGVPPRVPPQQQQHSQPHQQQQMSQQQTPISSPEASFSVPTSVDVKPQSCTSQYSSADEVFDEFAPLPSNQQQEDTSRNVDGVVPTTAGVVNEGEPYDVSSLLKIEGTGIFSFFQTLMSSAKSNFSVLAPIRDANEYRASGTPPCERKFINYFLPIWMQRRGVVLMPRRSNYHISEQWKKKLCRLNTKFPVFNYFVIILCFIGFPFSFGK